jgi:hypothetical protein
LASFTLAAFALAAFALAAFTLTFPLALALLSTTGSIAFFLSGSEVCQVER